MYVLYVLYTLCIYVCMYVYAICFIHIYSRSPESPSPVQSNKSDVKTKKKSGQKPDKKKATSVEQQPVHDAPVCS